jgi:hypothetical protein
VKELPVFDVLQVLVDPLGDERCRCRNRVNAEVRAAHRGDVDRLMREQETKLGFGFVGLTPWDNSNPTGVHLGVGERIFEPVLFAMH